MWLIGAVAAEAQLLPLQRAIEPSPASPSASDTSDIDALIEVLEDPDARLALLEKLRAVRAAQSAPSTPRPDAAPPDMIAATVMDEFATEFQRRTDSLFSIIADVVASADQLPVLAEWLGEQVADDAQRAVWIGVVGAIVLIVAIGLIARSFVLGLRPRLDSSHPRLSCIARFLVEIAAAVVFAAFTLGALWLANLLAARYLIDLTAVGSASLTLTIFLFAAMLWRATVRLLLGEPRCTVRLLPAPEEPARLGRDGLVRIGRLGLVGSGILVALHELGLPSSVFQFLLHVLFLTVAGIAIVLVLRLRDHVAGAVRRWNETSEAALARFVPGRFLARTWHYFAILLILLHYLIWALKVPGGIVFLSRATIATLAILVVARLATVGIEKLFEGGVTLPVEGPDLPAGVQERANRYATPARFILRALVVVIAFIAVATAWNTGVLEWLRSEIGRSFIGLLARLGLVIGLTILAIEITSLIAGRIVEATNEQGKPLHSNRVRTLTTIFANIFYFIFGLVGLFLALSNLGVETAPLLAGAGVVGLAIGFGSQALVKDLITGLFILLGDTIRVGDVVDIATKAGVVESMSMRTISLRSYDGSVHTIPYGSIDVVTNMTKEFSFAQLDIEISYKENTDEVIRAIREVDDRLRKEWPYRRLILEPIDIAGVERVANYAVILRMRSKTRPGEQWGIRREFLRRIKQRFDELGIAIPYPHQTLYFGRGGDSELPPLRIETMSRALREAEAETEPAAEAAPAAAPVVAHGAGRGRSGA